MRSSDGERSWSAKSHFLEERVRAMQFGTTAVGSLSPPKPAFMRPPPLSKTTTFCILMLVVRGNCRWPGNGRSYRAKLCKYINKFTT